jgi:16S rRNA (uracil1498-N3)-methyltransferase
VLRRVHLPELRSGDVDLDDTAGRHVRNVLRLTVGTEVELFDDRGATARGHIIALEPHVAVRVGEVKRPGGDAVSIVVAAAVPKGERADWMVEKLSELGCGRFIPIAAERSVVLPAGRNKRERWLRLATESARQSRRAGVMKIEELTPLQDALATIAHRASTTALFLSTAPSAEPISSVVNRASSEFVLFIGPEGGWTEQEIALFATHHVRAARLTETVLRVETAAVAAMAVVGCAFASNQPKRT